MAWVIKQPTRNDQKFAKVYILMLLGHPGLAMDDESCVVKDADLIRV